MRFSNLHKLTLVALLALVGLSLMGLLPGLITHAGQQMQARVLDNGQQQVMDAFANHQRNLQVQVTATVSRILSDDTKAPRHQRFILQLTNGQTVLVAHNIDLAPRIPGLGEGDTVIVAGVYEWNDKGGVIHWTHHDPDGSHQAGWIEFNGHRYQ